jgi:hypothetical protein
MHDFVDIHLWIIHFGDLGKPLAANLTIRIPVGIFLHSFAQAIALLTASKVHDKIAYAASASEQPCSSLPQLALPPTATSWIDAKTKLPQLLKGSLEIAKPIEVEPEPTPEPESEPEPDTFVRLVNPEDGAGFGHDFESWLELLNDGIYEQVPELCSDCEGGTYFLLDPEGERIAVFKPNDEDPQAVNNPKRKEKEGGVVEPVRKTVPIGGAALREVAAYQIDRGFARVPETALVRVKHPLFGGVKEGSLQRFVTHECGSWDLPPYRFAEDDVHRIGLFDLRCLNTDRHGGNMLAVRKNSDRNGKDGTHALVPIDHGFAFPVAFGEENFEWRFWPQAKRPFSAKTKELVEMISVEEDCNLLRKFGLCERAVWLHRVMTTFVKRGVAAGCTLADLANFCCRKRDAPSQLEAVCQQAQDLAQQEGSDFFGTHLEKALDSLFAAKN